MSVQLRTITLATAPFSLQPGTAQRDPEGYEDFWQRVASSSAGIAAAAGTTAVAEHAGRRGEDGHYATLSEDSLERPLQLLTVRLAPEAAMLPVPEDCAVLAAEMRLFDHNVAILETVIDLTEWLGNQALTTQRAIELEQLAHTLGKSVCEGFGAHWVRSLDEMAERFDRDEAVLRRDLEDMTLDLRWTARALFTDRATERGLELAPRWLRETSSDTRVVEELIAGQRDHVISWLNYLILDEDPRRAALMVDRGRASDLWSGLRYAQYFYSALDQVDARLGEVLAFTHAEMTGRELADLREELTDASHSADLIIIERQRTEKYLRRAVRSTMQGVLAEWDTDTLVEQPVRHKADLCAQRVAAIEGDLARRASVWTDLILLGIAITSILGTALTVVSFGRTLGSDAGMAGYDSGSSGVIEWLASQPADAVLLTSLVVSASLALIYVLYRRSSQS